MIEKIAPFFLGFILLSIVIEAIISSKKQMKLYEVKDTWTNITFGVLGVLTRLAFKGINLAIWIFLYRLSPFKIETSAFSLFLLFLANEFVYYWFHRLSHVIPILWATHVNHHSSLKMNFSVAARTPFLNAVYHILFWLPLPLIGFNPIDILLVETLSFLFAFIQHTTLIPKLGFLEWFINTPSHHRVHHASNKQYINKNFGHTLIIFDRLFGTFKLEEETPVYGLTKNPVKRNLVTLIFHEWNAIVNKRAKTEG
ncbi:MAG: sterol desaturase/sphingolipid hydroxylase (fatty acid hydroxylase superfamily) [Bacteroidia bacterium]|jgi:sterol desaturase/sphingolipid hydroxylase (fatty acid hydroxylase superfamily)